jgi:pyruvate dehydrogenase E1 component beta subunit
MARITMRQAITDALREEMYRDERVFIMGEEVGVWGGTYAVTRGFYDEFGPKQCAIHPFQKWSSAARLSVRLWPVCGPLPNL